MCNISSNYDSFRCKQQKIEVELNITIKNYKIFVYYENKIVRSVITKKKSFLMHSQKCN